MDENKKRGSFIDKIIGTIGIGVSLYGLKKVIDLYIDGELENVITKEEYEDLIQLEKNELRENFFNYDQLEIENKSDELFKELLFAIEINNEVPDKIFKVSDIEKLRPFEKTKFRNKDRYNDSIIKILSDYSNKEYIIFINESGLEDRIGREHLEEMKNSEEIIKKYLNKRFIINGKYYYKRKK